MRIEQNDEVLLDDGTFYVALCSEQRGPRTASGVLRKRCPVSARTPFGYDCIGQFSEQPDGRWLAGIDVASGVGCGVEEYLVASGVERMMAIVLLWQVRWNAFCRHGAYDR